MPRMVDAHCINCEYEYHDKFFMDVPDVLVCPQCGAAMDRIWSVLGTRPTQWAESEAIVIFRKPDGTFSFPARNDKPTPPGCERIVGRSDREVAKIEQMTKTLNHNRWFDNGSGRGFDDYYNGRKVTH
jgi:hypothetical protein